MNCPRCDDKGYYWRVPEGFNPFYAGALSTARAMSKVTCSCATRMTTRPALADKEMGCD